MEREERSIQSLTEQLETAQGLERVRLLSKLAYALCRSDPVRSVERAEEGLALLADEADPALEARLLLALCNSHQILGRLSRSVETGRRALELYRSLQDEPGEGNCRNRLGLAHWKMGAIEPALEELRSALAIRERMGDQAQVATTLSNLGIVEAGRAAYQEGLRYYMRALEIREAIDDREGVCQTLVNIGNVYRKMRDLDRALEYQTRGLEMARELGARRWMAYALNNLGNIHLDREEFEPARSHYREALVIKREIGDLQSVAPTLVNLGRVHAELGETEEALGLFDQALEMGRESGSRSDVAYAHTHRGEVLMALGRTDQAREELQRGIQGARDMEDGYLARIACHAMAELLRQQGEFRQALEVFQEYHRVHSEMLEQRAQERIQELELRLQAEQRSREMEIYRLRSVELAKANEELATFVFTVSHDLKAPLISLEGYVGLLQEEHGEKLDEDALVYLDRIVANTGKMSALVKDLLELSRIGRIQDSLTEVEVEGLIQEVLIPLRSRLAEAGGRVNVILPMPTISYDRTRLSQVFSNLLDNALKYSDPRRPPAVKIEAEATEEGYRFTVADNGIGIAPEHQERIFGMFQRLHGQSEYEGTGMGLAIVRKIVEAFGGEIQVASREGEGSTFTFTVPVISFAGF